MADELMTLLEFAGSGDDEESLSVVRNQTHDAVLGVLRCRGLRQVSPVKWGTYEPDYAEDALRQADLLDDPRSRDLIDWLAVNPGTVLVITSVDYR